MFFLLILQSLRVTELQTTSVTSSYIFDMTYTCTKKFCVIQNVVIQGPPYHEQYFLFISFQLASDSNNFTSLIIWFAGRYHFCVQAPPRNVVSLLFLKEILMQAKSRLKCIMFQNNNDINCFPLSNSRLGAPRIIATSLPMYDDTDCNEQCDTIKSTLPQLLFIVTWSILVLTRYSVDWFSLLLCIYGN